MIPGLALAAFGGCLFAPFQFDDFGIISDQIITAPDGWLRAWGLHQTRPLSWFSFWANYQTGGESPFGYHLVNLVLHVCVAWLLFRFLNKLYGDGLFGERVAWIGAALFAAHPVVSEPVNYISARPILLAAIFVLLALEDWADQRRGRATGWFTLAMLSKEECAALPLVFALFDWVRFRKIAWKPILATLAITLALGIRVVAMVEMLRDSQAGTQAGVSPLLYALSQGQVIWRYLVRIFVPWGFAVDYDIRQSWWLGVAGWIGLVGVLLMLVRRMSWVNAPLWLVTGFLLLLPSSSIFPAADVMADRRMYLPMLAFSAALGLCLHERLKTSYLIVGLVVLTAISVRYTLVWQDPERLWSEALAKSPDKVRTRLQLARSVTPELALGILSNTGSSKDDPDIQTEMGRVLLVLNRADDALAAFGKVLAVRPGDARAINNRGAALAAMGQAQAAEGDFRRALEKDPCLFDALLNLHEMGKAAPPGRECRYSPRERKLLGL